jgi:hypothetical protein
VERVLADIDASYGDRGVSVLLVFGAPCQRNLRAGQEHGRTIPLPEVRGAYFELRLARSPRRPFSDYHEWCPQRRIGVQRVRRRAGNLDDSLFAERCQGRSERDREAECL